MPEQKASSGIDWVKAAGKPTGGAPAEIPKLPDALNDHTTGEAKLRTKKVLGAMGHDPAIVDSVVAPNMPNTDALDKLFTQVEPLPAQDQIVGEFAWQMFKEMKDDGITLEDLDLESIKGYMSKTGGESLRAIMGARKFSNELNENFGVAAASFASNRFTDISLGLASLDWAVRMNKKFKLKGEIDFPLLPAIRVMKPMISDAKVRAEIEQRILPSVTIETQAGPKEFQDGTAASWFLGREQVIGWAERHAFSQIPKAASAIIRGLGMESVTPLKAQYFDDIADGMREHGADRINKARGTVSPMVAALGDPFTWQDVDEAANPERWEMFYDKLSQASPSDRRAAMALTSWTTGWLDILLDPLWVVGAVPGRTMAAGRALMKAANPAKAAKITSSIAHHTAKMEDAIEAVKGAQNWFDRTNMRAMQEAEAGRYTLKTNYELKAAAKALANEKSFMAENFADPGPYTQIYVNRTARMNPNLLHDFKGDLREAVKTGKISRGEVKAAAREIGLKNFTDEANQEIIREVRRTRKAALRGDYTYNPDWNPTLDTKELRHRAFMGPSIGEQGGDNLNALARGASIDDIATTPFTPEYPMRADTPVGLIDWRKTALAGELDKAKMDWAMTYGLLDDDAVGATKQLNLMASSSLYLKGREDAIGKSLGAARRLKGMYKEEGQDLTEIDKTIGFWRRQLRKSKQARRSLRKKSAEGKIPEFDESVLPPKTEAPLSTPAKLNKFLSNTGDFMVRTLYPGGMRYGWWDTNLGQMHVMLKEPQRYYEAMDPAAWNRMRANSLRYQQTLDADTHFLYSTLKESGLIADHKKFDPERMWAPYKTSDPDRMLHVFEMLNNPRPRAGRPSKNSQRRRLHSRNCGTRQMTAQSSVMINCASGSTTRPINRASRTPSGT